MTLSVAKRKGTNAIDATRARRTRNRHDAGSVPADVDIAITRNYGETAAREVERAAVHMLLAMLSVAVLIGSRWAVGNPGLCCSPIPVTLALTLFVFYLYGYTLNRITLFALIFSIGILVDDAIVVVENIVRHCAVAGRRGTSAGAAWRSRRWTRSAIPRFWRRSRSSRAILPMAFVGGLMGPYMRPIPVGASAAMVFSLLVAFVVTPWAALRLLNRGQRARE